MIDPIVIKIKKINEFQERLIEMCDVRHALLTEDKMDEAETIHRKEMLMIFDLEKEMQSLRKEVQSLCEQVGVKEKKINALIPHLSLKEIDEIMACQQAAFTYEKILKNKLKSNESLVKSKMALLEIIRNSYVQISQEAGENGKSLLSRKY